MNDLSNSSIAQPVAQSTNQPADSDLTGATSSGNKEVVGGADHPDTLRDVTEVSIPKEVASAGVKIHPTTVPIPAKVSQMGVKPIGNNIPVQTVSTVVLPISDDVIAEGLGQGVTSSWRWFSEWCLRRMKQLHVMVKIVHGKLIRVTA
jgi:hypothetical protein